MATRAATYAQLSLRDFSGGLNLQAAPSELAATETPDCMNFTLDERGGVVKRLGFSKIANVSALTATPQILYYSPVLDKLLLQVGTGLYKSDDGGANWSASLKTFSSSARVGICDFAGKAVIIHPVDGAFTYDGATFSGKVTNSPNGGVLAVWQNAIWSCGDTAQPTRLTRSDLGAITWPASPVTNDLRMKDDTALTALSVAGGNALLAFKEASIYRVNDPTTASYAMLSPTYGASGPLCVALNGDLCAAMSRRGVVICDGVREPTLVSGRLEPLFRFDQLAFTTSPDWCAGSFRDRFVFSLARTGASANNLTLEFHPRYGWIVPHDFGVQAFTNYTSGTRRTLASKVAAGTVTATFDCFVGGTDDGSAITSRFQTPWLEPANATLCRLRRLRVHGRGTFNVSTRADYADAGIDNTFLPQSGLTLWNGSTWGGGLWNASLYEMIEDFYSLGVARAVSFVLSGTSSASTTSPKILAGATAEIGDFACYGLRLDHIPLGGT